METKISGSCIASIHVAMKNRKVRYMYREKPRGRYQDSGWRFLCGKEDEEYCANPNNFVVYNMEMICMKNPNIIKYLSLPIGTKLRMKSPKKFEIVE